MAERNLEQTDMFSVLSSTLQLVCCRCNRTPDEQLLPVPFCTRHYVCRSCFLCGGGMQYCPGCVAARTSSGVGLGSQDSQRATTMSWSHALGGINGAAAEMAAAAAAKTDSNGNGPPTTICDVCSTCGRRTSLFCCESCSDAGTSTRWLCQLCWQQHQLDHVAPRLRLDAAAASSASGQELHPAPMSSDDHQRHGGTSNSVLRQIRPRLMMPGARDDQPVSSLFGGLMIQPSSTSDSSMVVSSTPSLTSAVVRPANGLLAVGLHEPSARHGRLAALRAPLAAQYECWLWQAFNNGGFEQAARNIDERKQQIAVYLQSTLRDMEFRLERARGVLDELYGECMRQVIEVSRCQLEALQASDVTIR